MCLVTQTFRRNITPDTQCFFVFFFTITIKKKMSHQTPNYYHVWCGYKYYKKMCCTRHPIIPVSGVAINNRKNMSHQTPNYSHVWCKYLHQTPNVSNIWCHKTKLRAYLKWSNNQNTHICTSLSC